MSGWDGIDTRWAGHDLGVVRGLFDALMTVSNREQASALFEAYADMQRRAGFGRDVARTNVLYVLGYAAPADQEQARAKRRLFAEVTADA